MKRILTFAAALALIAAFAGCKSNIANLREHISPTYHDVIVEADQDAAYTASLAALSQMGYTITSRGAAQKKIEGISAVTTDSMSRLARQTSVSVRFGVAPNNTTAIQILFTEIVEDPSGGRQGSGTKQPLTSSGLYNVFEKQVNEALKPNKAG